MTYAHSECTGRLHRRGGGRGTPQNHRGLHDRVCSSAPRQQPNATFAFLNRGGADPTGQSRMAYARFKGEAEKALAAARFPRVYIFRPRYIYLDERNSGEAVEKKAGLRFTSRDTVRSETSVPNLPNSPWIRGARHSGFAAAMFIRVFEWSKSYTGARNGPALSAGSIGGEASGDASARRCPGARRSGLCANPAHALASSIQNSRSR
jgi:hypothetical protein